MYVYPYMYVCDSHMNDIHRLFFVFLTTSDKKRMLFGWSLVMAFELMFLLEVVVVVWMLVARMGGGKVSMVEKMLGNQVKYKELFPLLVLYFILQHNVVYLRRCLLPSILPQAINVV